MICFEWPAVAHSVQVTESIAQHLWIGLRQAHLSFAGIAA